MLNGTQPKNHTEEVIDEFLEENPRAAELAEMIVALETRKQTFERELKSSQTPERKKEWVTKLKEVDKQIRILQEEQAITSFVEDSIRVTVNKSHIDDLLEGPD